MAKPVVVIVGRPNVGKSTLVNRIAKASVAIVEDTPGVTRDLNYVDAEWEGKRFVVVDTGGFYPKHDDNIFTQIKEQALFAIDQADLIVHVLDGKEGVNPYDADLVEYLRASGKPVIWAANKIDAYSKESRVYDFFDLGLHEIISVSAVTGYNYEELLNRIAQAIPESEPEPMLDYPKVAIVGRPNVGKSTMVNSLLGKKRMLVSDIPGTTRDAVDSVATYYKRKYLLIDTAGIRRKDKFGYSIERFALVRTQRSIERADVVIIMLDASEGLVSDDQKIAGMVEEAQKSAIFVLNKWDKVEDPDKAYKKLTETIEKKIWFFSHASVLTTSGLEKKRITKLFSLIDTAMEERYRRVPTAALNRFASSISIPPLNGKRVKIFYMTQHSVAPPSFAIFTNLPDGFKDFHIRHIKARLREAFSFAGSPIEISIRKRGGD